MAMSQNPLGLGLDMVIQPEHPLTFHTSLSFALPNKRLLPVLQVSAMMEGQLENPHKDGGQCLSRGEGQGLGASQHWDQRKTRTVQSQNPGRHREM